MIAYLERKRATCQPHTVSAIATRLRYFGEFLAWADPELDSLASLDRLRHIEPYLTSLTEATRPGSEELITVADRPRRVRVVLAARSLRRPAPAPAPKATT
jgi:hypothetical protein